MDLHVAQMTSQKGIRAGLDAATVNATKVIRPPATAWSRAPTPALRCGRRGTRSRRSGCGRTGSRCGGRGRAWRRQRRWWRGCRWTEGPKLLVSHGAEQHENRRETICAGLSASYTRPITYRRTRSRRFGGTPAIGGFGGAPTHLSLLGASLKLHVPECIPTTILSRYEDCSALIMRRCSDGAVPPTNRVGARCPFDAGSTAVPFGYQL